MDLYLLERRIEDLSLGFLGFGFRIRGCVFLGLWVEDWSLEFWASALGFELGLRPEDLRFMHDSAQPAGEDSDRGLCTSLVYPEYVVTELTGSS